DATGTAYALPITTPELQQPLMAVALTCDTANDDCQAANLLGVDFGGGDNDSVTAGAPVTSRGYLIRNGGALRLAVTTLLAPATGF
ncbi:MAG: hypothetical protein ACRD1Y_04265, partial [Terriglobales bacterium]